MKRRGGLGNATAVMALACLSVGCLMILSATYGAAVASERAASVSVDDETIETTSDLLRVVTLDNPARTVTQSREVTVLNLTDSSGRGFTARTVAISGDPTGGELAIASSGFSDNGPDPGDRVATSGAAEVRLVCDGSTANPPETVTVSITAAVSAESVSLEFTREVRGIGVDCTRT